MTVYRLAPDRSALARVSFVVGRSFIVAVRGADAEVLAALSAHRGRDRIAAEELMACVPFSTNGAGTNGIGELLIVTVDGPDKNSTGTDAGALTESGTHERLITVVARGSLVVDVYSVGGSRRFGARGIKPFALAEFRAVTAFAVLLEDDAALSEHELYERGVSVPPGVLEAEGLAWAAGDRFIEETSWRPPTSEATVLLARGTPIAQSLDDTIISIAPFVEPQPAEPTTLRESISPAVTIARAQVAPQPQTPRAAHPRVFPVFRIGDAAAEALDGTIYLGRNPRVPSVVTHGHVKLRALASPSQAVSSTHASLERSGTTIVVTDLGSTNGTVVRLPGAAISRRLRGGESLALPPDSCVELGDDNVVYILSPAPAYSALDAGDTPTQ